MTVTVSAVANQPYRQTIQAGGHTYYSDVTAANGGGNTAPDPHQLLLGALGACTNMTLQMYARRKGWDLQEVKVTLDESMTRRNNVRVPQINKNIEVRGNLTPEQVSTLKAIAEKCPVNKLIMNEKDMISRMDLLG